MSNFDPQIFIFNEQGEFSYIKYPDIFILLSDGWAKFDETFNEENDEEYLIRIIAYNLSLLKLNSKKRGAFGLPIGLQNNSLILNQEFNCGDYYGRIIDHIESRQYNIIIYMIWINKSTYPVQIGVLSSINKPSKISINNYNNQK